MADTKAAPAAASGEKKERTAYEGVETAMVSLDRARVVRGTAYGPGTDIRVPKFVADAMKAEDAKAAKGTKQGKGKQK